MNWARPLKTAVLLLGLLVGFAIPRLEAASAPSNDEDLLEVYTASQNAGANFSWDNGSKSLKLTEKLRGLAIVILLIALVAAALYTGITGKSTPALFVAVGSVVLFGGFWILLLVIDAFGTGPPSQTQDVLIESPAQTKGDVALIVKDFIGYGINMLTTATMPFAMIYGFWMSLGIASGDSSGNSGAQIKNYVLGAIVAIGASIFTQLFFRW